MKTYTVLPGDSLSSISERFFGNWNEVDQIAALNNITQIDVIYPGQVLNIPDSAAVVVTASPLNDTAVKGLFLVAGAVAVYFAYKMVIKQKA